MRVWSFGVACICAAGLSACATTQSESANMSGLSSGARKAVEASSASTTAQDGDKVSLDASLDEYRTVTLVDDETGKPKVICRRVRQPGTLFEKKICATKEEWDNSRREAKDKTDGIQRNMDSRCPSCG